MTDDLPAAVDALLDACAVAWARNDPAALAALWTADDQTLFYKAEEVPHFFYSMDEMAAYWQHNVRFHEIVQLSFSNTLVRRLVGPLSLVVTHMRWDIRFAADARHADGAPFASAGNAMGGDNHVLAHVAATPEGLRFAGWCETPDAPISYVRRLYESAARV